MSQTTQPTTDAPIRDRAERFLNQYYEDAIAQLNGAHPSQRSITVDFGDLYEFDADLAMDYREAPNSVQPKLDQALATMDTAPQVSFSPNDVTVRVQNVHSDAVQIRHLRSDDVGEYVETRGQVKKTTQVKPAVVTAVWECRRCGATQERESGGRVEEPHECASCDRQGPFELLEKESETIDYQVARIQEPPEQAKGGAGESLDIRLKDDLVGELTPGDRVVVGGVYDAEYEGDEATLSTYIDGRNVQHEERDFEDINVDEHLDQIREIASGDPFETLLDSIAPKIMGMDRIKKAVLLQLFGAPRRTYPDGSEDRGASHLLLVGDPGCGKSTIMRAAEAIAPRSTYVSGKGLTAAGATAAATADEFGDNKWSLEAGALVLADKGLACIDEIDKVHEDAVSSLHGALEDGKVEVNKAGINATLPARTSLLAAGNPEYGRFDQDAHFAEQIDLDPAMISRFDLIFTLDDQPDPQRDEEIASHMIDARAAAGRRERGEDGAELIEPEVDADVLRAYIAHARQEVYPVIDDDAVKSALIDHYTGLRTANEGNNAVPVTARQLEAVQRLAEASARVRLSNTVEMQDVQRAVTLVEETLKDVGVDPTSGDLDVDVITTGTSTSQRERIETVRKTIQDLDNGSSDPATFDDILATVKEQGVTQSKLQHTLEMLRHEKGVIYQVGEDEYRWCGG